MTGRVRLSSVCAAFALCAAVPPSACAAGPRLTYSVGYESPAALRAAVTNRATVVRHVPALRVAQVRAAPAVAANVSRRAGIRFVERVVPRREAAEPALQLASGKTVAWEWQYAAAHEDAVPDWVLRRAASIMIAVVDTGADVSAPDIAAKHPVLFNARTRANDVPDTFGHGTFVAALAAGSVTNGEGIAGFGGDARLMVIKAGAGDGSFSDVDEAAAIAYAVDHGARIINLSLGGTRTSRTEQSAIDYAVHHGVLVVAAVGNLYLVGNPVVYPAALLQPFGSNGLGGRGLAVAASTASGVRASFSSTGTYVSLAAPGESVFSAISSASWSAAYVRVPLPGSLGGIYGYGSGTSFAAPQVAGAAALVLAANPLLDAAAVAQVLKESASGHGAWSPELGFGVIDAASAVELASHTPGRRAHAVRRLRWKPTKRQNLLRIGARWKGPR